MPTSTCLFLSTGVLLLLLGCRAAPERSPYPLPFAVKLKKAEIVESAAASKNGGSQPQTPALFESAEELTAALADVLWERGAFTAMLPDDVEHADLEMRVTIEGDDFGPGSPTTAGAVFSSIAWFFGGYFSWLIENREYPESNVILRITVLSDGGRGPIVFEDGLRVQGLRLNMWDRAGKKDWFLGLFLPPFYPEGDAEAAGRQLARQVVEFFADNELEEMQSRLPSLHVANLGCFLVHAPERRELIIVGRQPLLGVTLVGRGQRRSLPAEELSALEVDGNERAVLRLYLSERQVSVGEDDRVFRIPLQPSERGVIHIAAVLETNAARWTVVQPEVEADDAEGQVAMSAGEGADREGEGGGVRVAQEE